MTGQSCLQWWRKVKTPVRQCALRSHWPVEEKPLAARLSGVEVSLSSAIECLPFNLMNHGITGETEHCCLKASVALIHVSPPTLPFARPGHKPSRCPPLAHFSVSVSQLSLSHSTSSWPNVIFPPTYFCPIQEWTWWLIICSSTLTTAQVFN